MDSIPARDDGAFTPASSRGRKKQVEPIRHGGWIMNDQFGSILGNEYHCALAERGAWRANPNRNVDTFPSLTDSAVKQGIDRDIAVGGTLLRPVQGVRTDNLVRRRSRWL